MADVIKVSKLTKLYGDILAFDHISLSVREGETFGFLGHNGAGKTTTIRILTGLNRPTEGHARVLVYDIGSEIATAKRHIGVVPELSNLYDELSVMDNLSIEYIASFLSMKQSDEMCEQSSPLHYSDECLARLSLFRWRHTRCDGMLTRKKPTD